jgi:uncharacterized membrane protein YfcA
MIQAGIEPHAAVATNMLSPIFLSLGGTMPFLSGDVLCGRWLRSMIGLTLVGSVLGAALLVIAPAKTLPIVIGLAMLAVVAFSLIKPNAGLSSAVSRQDGVT